MNNESREPETEILIEKLPFGIKMVKREHIRYVHRIHTRCLGLSLLVFYILYKLTEHGFHDTLYAFTHRGQLQTYLIILTIFAIIDYTHQTLSSIELTHNRLIIRRGFLSTHEIQIDEISYIEEVHDDIYELNMKREQAVRVTYPFLFNYDYFSKKKTFKLSYGTLMRKHHFLDQFRRSLYIKDTIGFISDNKN